MIKKLMMLCFAAMAATGAWSATETVNGVEWTYVINNNVAYVGGGELVETNELGEVSSIVQTAIPVNTQGSVSIPYRLGGRMV